MDYRIAPRGRGFPTSQCSIEGKILKQDGWLRVVTPSAYIEEFPRSFVWWDNIEHTNHKESQKVVNRRNSQLLLVPPNLQAHLSRIFPKISSIGNLFELLTNSFMRSFASFICMMVDGLVTRDKSQWHFRLFRLFRVRELAGWGCSST